MRGRVLILAGTREARLVCGAAADRDVLASLAGATAAPLDLGVPTRTGGFGGDAGFAATLSKVVAVLDATHPYAVTMSERAARLCAARGMPYLRLTRPGFGAGPWRRHPGAEAAAAALPRGGRILLATGPGSLAPFLDRGLALWCRRVDPSPLQGDVEWIVGVPGTRAEETALMRRHRVTHLVTKDSGGARAKLDAAADLGIEVHMIDRPPRPPGEETHDIDRAIAFVRAHAADRDGG